MLPRTRAIASVTRRCRGLQSPGPDLDPTSMLHGVHARLVLFAVCFKVVLSNNGSIAFMVAPRGGVLRLPSMTNLVQTVEFLFRHAIRVLLPESRAFGREERQGSMQCFKKGRLPDSAGVVTWACKRPYSGEIGHLQSWSSHARPHNTTIVLYVVTPKFKAPLSCWQPPKSIKRRDPFSPA